MLYSKITQITKNLPEITDEKLVPYVNMVEDARNSIFKEIEGHNIAPLNIAYKEDDLEEIQNLADRISSNFKNILVLGVGGSSLGGKTLSAIKQNNNIEIDFLESIDVNTIKNKLDKIDLKSSFFLVVSKSGRTVETVCQTLIVLEEYRKIGTNKPADNFVFITEDKSSNVTDIAKEIGSEIYFHPKDIGGRFSYLTIVGLLPAAIYGLDIRKIRKGARELLDNSLNQKVSENNVVKICSLQLYLFDLGFNGNVIMPYIDTLKDFTDWYRQLWAESLGKNGFGSTPINSMGTIDQHSQLQLYLDGPKDKFFTFITNKDHKVDFKINDLDNCKTRFGGKSLSEIVEIEQNSTIEVLSEKNLPIRILELDELDEEILSSLMMRMFLETIIIAKVKNINPFDQPAVELRKEIAQKYFK